MRGFGETTGTHAGTSRDRRVCYPRQRVPRGASRMSGACTPRLASSRPRGKCVPKIACEAVIASASASVRVTLRRAPCSDTRHGGRDRPPSHACLLLANWVIPSASGGVTRVRIQGIRISRARAGRGDRSPLGTGRFGFPAQAGCSRRFRRKGARGGGGRRLRALPRSSLGSSSREIRARAPGRVVQ